MSRQNRTIRTATIIQLSRLSFIFLHIYQAGRKICTTQTFAIGRKKKGLKSIKDTNLGQTNVRYIFKILSFYALQDICIRGNKCLGTISYVTWF